MSPAASWLLVALFVGLPTLVFGCALRMASFCSRIEEEILAEELLRKSPEIKPTPKTRPYIRTTHTLDYASMTKADIAKALGYTPM